jgi:hypothetical protein
MKSFAAFLLLLPLAPPQDDLEKKVADLVARLADDSIDARDQAVEDLAALGPAAIPVLKKAQAKTGGEARGRIDEAIRKIELRDALAQSLPPLRKITLEQKNRPARQAIEEIARQAGLAVKFEGDLGAGPVTLSIKDVTPIEAFDAVCRKDGQLTYEPEVGEVAVVLRGPRPPTLSFTAAPFLEGPAAYVRHYRVRAVELSLIRTNTFKGMKSRGALQIDLHWLPDTHPDRVSKFEVTEIKDDQGRLLPLEKKEDEANGPLAGAHFTLDQGSDSTSSQFDVDFKFPEADAKKIASLKGTFVATYPKERKTLVFEKPRDMRGKSLDLHGLKLTLEDYQDRGTEHTIKIVVSGKYAGPKDPAKEGLGEEDSFYERLPFSTGEIEYVTESGEPLQHSSSSSSGNPDSYTFTVTLRAEKAEVLREIRIPCILTHHLDEVKFELTDIAFPK